MTQKDPIEALLKSTGRRPPVDADRTGRVRDAVRATWTLEVEAGARRRRVGWIVSLASAAAAVAAIGLGARFFGPTLAPEPSGVRVERVSNAPTLTVGLIVSRGATVTTGADARVALRAATGHSVRIDENTSLRVVSGAEFALLRGAVYVDSNSGNAGATESIRIETPVGTVLDLGTQFEARLADGTLELRVREGVVSVERGAAGRHVVRAGQALSLAASGRVETVEDPESGDTWTWVESIMPMMDIEGRTLRDFLDWVVRERGARLRFPDPAVAAKAPSIVLRGSIAGMTLDQATTSVLTTCGLRHRWEAGVLVVTP
jgi:hypothetical protein